MLLALSTIHSRLSLVTLSFAKAKLLVFKHYGNEIERVYVILQLIAVIILWDVTEYIRLKGFRAALTNLQPSIRL